MWHKELLLYIIIILFLTLLCISNGLFLNDTDGMVHYNFYKNNGCEDHSYSNSVCTVAELFGDISETQFWALWLIVLLAIPFLLYYFFRTELILPGFFIFTGLFFAIQSMQIYAQLIALIGFTLIIFSKPTKYKIGALLFFLIIDVLNLFVIHSQFKYILIFAIIIELAFMIKDKYMFSGVFFVSQLLSDIRYNVYDKGVSIENAFYFILYYGYTFLMEYMLFIFTLPGIIELWKHGDKRHLIYLGFICAGAIFYWVYESFNVWRVTRVLIFFPIIVLPYFIQWLEKQSVNRKRIFWCIGICYFIFNIIYFVVKQ